jgi:hypothetical protein
MKGQKVVFGVTLAVALALVLAMPGCKNAGGDSGGGGDGDSEIVAPETVTYTGGEGDTATALTITAAAPAESGRAYTPKSGDGYVLRYGGVEISRGTITIEIESSTITFTSTTGSTSGQTFTATITVTRVTFTKEVPLEGGGSQPIPPLAPPGGSASGFTVTDIPSAWNGQYAYAEGYVGNSVIIGAATQPTINSTHVAVAGVLIQNGTVTLPLWLVSDDGDGSSYTGSDTVSDFWVLGTATAAITEDSATTNVFTSEVIFASVTFSNGSATKAMSEGTMGGTGSSGDPGIEDDPGTTDATLAAYLASLASNTAENPYTVVLATAMGAPVIINTADTDPRGVWATVNNTVKAAGKYVILDLSTCTAADNTIEGGEMFDGGNAANRAVYLQKNRFNIIHGTAYI